jgi:RimJ/RimL family protein N-acetyltransferase
MTTISIPTLTTERLTLRCPQMSDFDAYADFRMGPRAKFVGGAKSRDECFTKFGEIIGHWQLRGFGRWLVADRTTDAPLGIVGLYHPEDWPEREIAWSLFDAGLGRGVAYEASFAARDYAYTTLGWTTAASMIVADNIRSIALAKRLGATFEQTYAHPALGDLQIWRHLPPSAAKATA